MTFLARNPCKTALFVCQKKPWQNLGKLGKPDLALQLPRIRNYRLWKLRFPPPQFLLEQLDRDVVGSQQSHPVEETSDRTLGRVDDLGGLVEMHLRADQVELQRLILIDVNGKIFEHGYCSVIGLSPSGLGRSAFESVLTVNRAVTPTA